MTNVFTEGALKHENCKHFTKRNDLLRSEVSCCAQTRVDLQLLRSTCLACRISTGKELFPRSGFTSAPDLDILHAGRSPNAVSLRSSRNRLITMVKKGNV